MNVSTQLDARFRDAAAAEGLFDVAYDVVDSPLGPLCARREPSTSRAASSRSTSRGGGRGSRSASTSGPQQRSIAPCSPSSHASRTAR
jgi:hypothetical protein